MMWRGRTSPTVSLAVLKTIEIVALNIGPLEILQCSGSLSSEVWTQFVSFVQSRVLIASGSSHMTFGQSSYLVCAGRSLSDFW